MPEFVTCADCRRKLRVPDDMLDKAALSAVPGHVHRPPAAAAGGIALW